MLQMNSRCLPVVAGFCLICVLLAQPVQAAQEAKPQGALTTADLPGLLENMGYEPKDLGNGAYQVTIESGGWTNAVRISVSPNGKNIWVYSYLGELPATGVAVERLLKLLVLNNDIGPMHFSIAKDGDVPKWLYLNVVVENRAVKPANIREAIDNLVSNTRRTGDDWDVSKWSAPESATAPTTSALPPASSNDGPTAGGAPAPTSESGQSTTAPKQ
ncbi:MAG: hypothetical protein U1F68_02345 [Gammaproteobacteria bacterium]